MTTPTVDLLAEWEGEVTPPCSCTTVHTELPPADWMVRDPRLCACNGGWTPTCDPCLVRIRERCRIGTWCIECHTEADSSVRAVPIRGAT